MTLIGTWLCTHCSEFCEESQLRRDGCCPVCGADVEIIKPKPELTGIERTLGATA